MTDLLAVMLREAYATGWAASGGPMTERVKAGCTAAIECGLAHPSEAHLIEATLHLGHLEGIWAKIFDRRLKLHADNETDILAVWKPMAVDLDVNTLIRHVTSTDEAIDISAKRIASIGARVTAMLKQLRHSGQWKALRQAVRTAIAKARAEGTADALALAADGLGQIGFSFDIAFDKAYAALEKAPELLTEADTWLVEALGDQATAVGKKLAALVRDEASADDMNTAVTALLGDATPVALVIDQLTSRAMSQGALDLYSSESVEQVDFVSAGDDRVCSECQEDEAGSPYAVADAPRPGIHPLCRCVLQSSDPLPLSAVSSYLTDGG